MTEPSPHYDFNAMQLRQQVAQAALTDITKLDGAFKWDCSPQGHAYWERQAANGLDPDARSTLAYMVAESLHMEITTQFFRRAA